MPRLVEPLAVEPVGEVADLAKFFNETLGFTPNSILTMQRRPAIAKAFIELNKAVMDPSGGVTSQLKRLIGYISSLTAGCQYCQAHTALAAKRYGVSDAKFDDVWVYRESPHYTQAEKAALEFALAASCVPNAVTPEITADLRAHWDDGQIVEILGVVSLFGFLNRWNDSMGTRLEEGAQKAGATDLAGEGWDGGKHVVD